MHYNNVYYAYNGTKYFYIPSGTDQTFQCRSVTGTTSTMNECNSKNCASQYEKILEIVYDKRERHAVCNWYITVIISTIVPIVSTLFLWFLQKYWFTVAWNVVLKMLYYKMFIGKKNRRGHKSKNQTRPWQRQTIKKIIRS